MARTPNVSGIVSLRLTPEERRRVEEAAAVKGWKVAHFLRVAAFERATHVLNLSQRKSFDFGGIARRAADALARQREVEMYTTTQDRIGRFGLGILDHATLERSPARNVDLGEVELREISPAPFTKEAVDELSEAIRFGGLEFVEQLLFECRRLVVDPNDPSLPAPLDPASVADGEVE